MHRLIICAGVFLLAVLATPGRANAATYYVCQHAPGASDANDGLAPAMAQAGHGPWLTIQKAADTARPGDTVLVGPGIYPEEVRLSQSRITFRALVPGERPCIDGGETRTRGIHMPNGGALEDIVIDGFEIARQTDTAIYAGVGQAKRFIIRNNLVHHVRSQGIWLGGTGHLVEKNTIHTIGNDQEARGILLSANYRTEVTECIARGNQIYLCKKEGIRDYGGYNNLIEGNIIYGSTYGISINATRGGTRIFNNYISHVIHGYNPKHTTGEHGWNIFWHNTIHDSAYWAVSIGSPPLGDYVDVRNNIFSRSGDAHIMHALDCTGPNVRLDGNLYHADGNRPPLLYTTHGGPRKRLASLPALRAQSGFEAAGLTFNPLLLNPDRGDLDYPPSSPAAAGSLALQSPYGRQLGARGLTQTTPFLVRLPLKAIAASSNAESMGNTADNLAATYWNSAPHNRDQWITYDLGAEQSFRYIMLIPLQHKVQYNIKKYAFEISSDGKSFRPLLAGENNDSGSFFIYELEPQARGRFLRFHMLENFPDDGLAWTSDSFVFSDLWVANLVLQSRVQPAESRRTAPDDSP